MEPVSETPSTMDDFGLNQDRMNYVGGLARRRFNDRRSLGGLNYRVYPPQILLDDPAAMNAPEVFERLKDTVWWIAWPDARYDQLRFIEFLIFVQYQLVMKVGMDEAQKKIRIAGAHRASKHGGGWQPKKDRTKKPQKPVAETTVEIKTTVNPAELSKDERARALVRGVSLESTAKPYVAIN